MSSLGPAPPPYVEPEDLKTLSHHLLGLIESPSTQSRSTGTANGSHPSSERTRSRRHRRARSESDSDSDMDNHNGGFYKNRIKGGNQITGGNNVINHGSNNKGYQYLNGGSKQGRSRDEDKSPRKGGSGSDSSLNLAYTPFLLLVGGIITFLYWSGLAASMSPGWSSVVAY
ncbi:hypothetical protein BKA70DRAFT_1285985 [Coprinopsis sp. MPI-PUGE-AT-0042]|nr:hypothetical protein BKA70DRAFT_740272 [Coprinopsis sp. MPI-PUGE-AT-0042]KAH6907003.1 hypothetical protein BKA70DRAFT_1285985 [Coprinopsis sp. MPI-PUGE-AT-0042]